MVGPRDAVMEAWRLIARLGLAPDIFWQMTPYAFISWAAEADQSDRRLAWYIAALSRQRRLPAFDVFCNPRRTPEITPGKTAREDLQELFNEHGS